MLVQVESKCGNHELAKGKRDTGIYRCGNCKYCKGLRQTVSGNYVGECKNPRGRVYK